MELEGDGIGSWVVSAEGRFDAIPKKNVTEDLDLAEVDTKLTWMGPPLAKG